MAAAAIVSVADAMDTDTIGLSVLIVALATIFIAGKLQERSRKEGPPS